MIGLGKWECPVETMFFKGVAALTISDNNGAYNFELEVPEVKIPEIVVKEVKEDGNTLIAVATCDLLKGKDLNVNATFEGDSVTGFIKVPFLGKIKLNGKKIG